MKRAFVSGLAAVILLASMPYCKKKKTNPCDEAQIQVTTTPAVNTTEAPAPGPNFALQVSISSIPANGVTIEVKARPEASTTPFFSETRSSTSATNDFTITNTPATTPSIVEITVTSKNCSTNKFTGSYRFSKK